jgi:hypothetical protein
MKAKQGSRYREYKDWFGGYYDANAFDLDEVNERRRNQTVAIVPSASPWIEPF